MAAKKAAKKATKNAKPPSPPQVTDPGALEYLSVPHSDGTELSDPIIQDFVLIAGYNRREYLEWEDVQPLLDVAGPSINPYAINQFLSIDPERVGALVASMEAPAPAAEHGFPNVKRAIELILEVETLVRHKQSDILSQMNIGTFRALCGILERRHKSRLPTGSSAVSEAIDYLPAAVIAREKQLKSLLRTALPKIDILVERMTTELRARSSNPFPRLPCPLIRALQFASSPDVPLPNLKRMAKDFFAKSYSRFPSELTPFFKYAKDIDAANKGNPRNQIGTPSNPEDPMKLMWSDQNVIKSHITLIWLCRHFNDYFVMEAMHDSSLIKSTQEACLPPTEKDLAYNQLREECEKEFEYWPKIVTLFAEFGMKRCAFSNYELSDMIDQFTSEFGKTQKASDKRDKHIAPALMWLMSHAGKEVFAGTYGTLDLDETTRLHDVTIIQCLNIINDRTLMKPSQRSQLDLLGSGSHRRSGKGKSS